jgi:hypothetical protein
VALTGKTIGELDLLQFPTNNTLLPVEYNEGSYHISFSSITYNEGSYSQFVVEANSGLLTPGRLYLMSDYQTCYDQPNYTNEGVAILTGNYKTGTTEPILLLATSITGFSPTVYSTLYPNDKITYDITWNTTEVTSSPAKGRITERIDRFNNRADYDFRAVQFIRYQSFFSQAYYHGTLSIDGLGNVVGVGTDFTNDFSVGNILGIHSPNGGNLIGGFAYYEILTVTDATNMTVTGTTFYPESNKFYSRGESSGNMSPFQCNVPTSSYTGFTEYYTFHNENSYNTYLGDNQNYVNFGDFILSNNVFLNGTYQNMTFGGSVLGNTFDNVMSNTTCGPFFQYNIITNNFDENTIGPEFTFNFIDCDMQGNSIVGNFNYNMLGDDDGNDFDSNEIGWGFQSNFLSLDIGDFFNNQIGSYFYQNIIDNSFDSNVIGDNFNTNRIEDNFDNNQIGGNFYGNLIKQTFADNVLGTNVYSNNFYGNFEKNTGGPYLFSNNFYNNVLYNTLGPDFDTNNVGDVNNIQNFTFDYNSFQGGCSNNTFTGYTQYNKVGHEFFNNTIATNFSYNQIGDYFNNNMIASNFGYGGGNYRGNVIGNGFGFNTIGEYFYDNTIGDSFSSNQVQDYFVNNKVSYGMVSSTFADLDTSGQCKNNTFTYTNVTNNFTRTGGFGGNAILYTDIPANILIDAADSFVYITFLSGGTIVSQPIIN